MIQLCLLTRTKGFNFLLRAGKGVESRSPWRIGSPSVPSLSLSCLFPSSFPVSHSQTIVHASWAGTTNPSITNQRL